MNMIEYEGVVKRRWRMAQRVIVTLKECNSQKKIKGRLMTMHSNHRNSKVLEHDSTMSYSLGSLFRSTILGEDTFITKKYFVLAMITEFQYPSPTMSFEKLLNAYFQTSTYLLHQNIQERGDKRILLFTLLALEWKRCIMNHPPTFFFHCLHLITEDDDKYKIDDILSILSLGEISSDQTIHLQEYFLILCSRHASVRLSSSSWPQRPVLSLVKNTPTHVDKETLILIFELCPKIIFDFRDSIVQHFDSQDRLQELERSEESCLGSLLKVSNHIKVIRKWKSLLFHTLEAWYQYTQEVKKIHRIQSHISETKLQRIFNDWRLLTTASLLAKRINITINQDVKNQVVLHWKHYVDTSKYIQRICFKQSQRFKHLLVASGRLNRIYWRIQLRLQLNVWRDETQYLIRLSQAVRWSYTQMKRRSVLAWRIKTRSARRNQVVIDHKGV